MRIAAGLRPQDDYVLDSHLLIWLHGDRRRIGKQAAKVLQAPDSHIAIPSFARAEIKYVCAHKRLPVSHLDVLRLIEADSRCRIHPLDLETVGHLPLSRDLHDGIFVATALAIEAATGEPTALLTCDEQIADSGLVRAVW